MVFTLRKTCSGNGLKKGQKQHGFSRVDNP
jgi:hypothetical protein